MSLGKVRRQGYGPSFWGGIQWPADSRAAWKSCSGVTAVRGHGHRTGYGRNLQVLKIREAGLVSFRQFGCEIGLRHRITLQSKRLHRFRHALPDAKIARAEKSDLHLVSVPSECRERVEQSI